MEGGFAGSGALARQAATPAMHRENAMSPTSRVRVATTLILTLALGAGTAGAALTPLSPPPEGPVTPEYATAHARQQEALVKARFAAGLAKALARKTPNQALYDVTHYDIDIALSPSTQTLSGKVTVTARVTGPSLATLDLDLRAGMAVSQCTAAGSPTTFSRSLDVLTVNLDRAYATGETVVAQVTYSGDPSGEAFGWSYYNTQPLIWTLSEPYGARDWWPCKDLNDDKADSVDVRVTVPDNLLVASNGRLVSDVDLGPTRTFHWKHRYPIATYLVSVTAHPFVKFSHWYTPLAGGQPMEVAYYVVPNRLANAQTGYLPTAAMIEAFAEGWGEYPFVDEKYGHAHFVWGGGMEHQTCTSLYYNSYSPGLIAHELAHQWWGDLVTCADFQHIWLNEGFATWAEAYWREKSEGMAGYHAEMNAAAYYGAGTIFVEDPTDFGAIFNYSLSYLKASWVVHMLRGVLGDTDFFAALAAYRAQYGFGSATTEQLRDVCEAVSGRDLDAFFQQWIYGEYYPAYAYEWWFAPEGGGTRVSLRVRQTQTNAGLFSMPLQVFVDTDQGTTVHVVENSQADELYAFTVPGNATGLQLDRDRWVLCTATGQAATGAPDLPAASARLDPAYPNPFNPAAWVPYELPRAGRATLAVHDAAGRRVRTLAAGELPAGPGRARWDGRDQGGRPVASGTYFARLEFAGQVWTRSLTLAR